MELHLPGADRGRKHLASKILIVGLRQQVDEAIAVEQVDAHARPERAALGRDSLLFDPGGVGADEVEVGDGLRLLEKPLDAARTVDSHDPQPAGRLLMHRDAGDGHVSPARDVRGEHVGVVHPIELVAREDQHVADVGLLQVADVLAHRVGRALVPAGIVERLLGSEDLDEAAAEGIEGIGATDVTVQAHGVELGKHVDPLHAAVDAVGQRHVDDAVLARERHGRLRAVAGQRIEPGATAAAKNQSQNALHSHGGPSMSGCSCGRPLSASGATMQREPPPPAK